MQKSELVCRGRCDGLGDLDPTGSYVRLAYESRNERLDIVISEGAAEVLIAELQGALRQNTDATVANLMRAAIDVKRDHQQTD